MNIIFYIFKNINLFIQKIYFFFHIFYVLKFYYCSNKIKVTLNSY